MAAENGSDGDNSYGNNLKQLGLLLGKVVCNDILLYTYPSRQFDSDHV